MSSRVLCKTPGCGRTILETTAAKTDGYCMVCVREKAQRERQEYIRNNIQDVDPYVGVTDPVEIIQIMLLPRRYDPLTRLLPYPESCEEVYSKLSANQIIQLAQKAIDLTTEGSDVSRPLISTLAAFTSNPLEDLLLHLIKHRLFYPSFVFKRATSVVQRELVSANKGVSSSERNHYLQALAWAGGSEIFELFLNWKQAAPSWSSELFIAPNSYSTVAGWEITPQGRERLLFSPVCFALVPKTDDVSVQIGNSEAARCPWCERNLISLLRIDYNQCSLPKPSADWNVLTIATCQACTCFGYVFTAVNQSGDFQWLESPKPPFLDTTSEWEAFPDSLSLGKQRDSLHAADQFLPTSFSQIGGYPCWIQDPDFPNCPRCSRRMPFVAQVDMADVHKHGEGTYYAYLCVECEIAATSYQQT